MWASSSTASHQLLPAHRPAPSLARLAQQVKVQTLYAVAMPLAERKAAASREEVALPRHHLEALYQSDTEPASCLWQSPLAFGYADSDALLRPELLRMAVMEKNESPASAKQAEEERRKRQDYYANVGDAIRTLREEIPRIFVQDLTCELLPHAAPLSGLLLLWGWSPFHPAHWHPAHWFCSSSGFAPDSRLGLPVLQLASRACHRLRLS